MGAAVAGTAAPAAAHPLHAASGSLSWPDVLGRSALGTAVLWSTLPLAGLLLAALWARGRAVSEAFLGAGLVVAVAFLRGGRGLGPLAFGLLVVHLLAAAVWLGGLLDLIVRRDDRWDAARRFGPVGLAAIVALVLSGVLNVRVHTGGQPLAGGYEHVLGLKVALVIGALTLGSVAHRRVRRRRAPSRRLIGGEAGLLVTIFAAGAALAALPAAAAVGPNVAVLRVRGRVTVRSAGRTFRESGPNAEECASHTAGVLLAGGDPRRLPCSSTSSEASRFGAAFADFLAGQKVASAVVVADDTPRSAAMTEGFIRNAGVAHIDVHVVHTAPDVSSWGDAAVITSGWSTAREILAAVDVAPRPPVRGAFLAPWLLSSDVTGGPRPVQLAVGLPFDPSASTAGAYLDQTARRAPTVVASEAGLEGWLAARGVAAQAPSAIQFFTPARIDILPPSIDIGHDHGGASWVSGGQMAAISGLVRLNG